MLDGSSQHRISHPACELVRHSLASSHQEEHHDVEGAQSGGAI